MRRTLLALTVLASLAIVASGGSGALGNISGGPLSASPNDMSFGHVAQGAPQTTTETLQNNGTQTLNIQSVQVSGPDQGDFTLSGDTCMNGQSQLNVGDSCSVDVMFDPSGTGGETASLDITDDDTADGDTQSQDLGGTGVASQFSLTTPTDFGDVVVGQRAPDQTVTVTNNTDYTANPTGPTISGADASDFGIDTNTCGGTVAGNASCTFGVNFTPGGTGSEHATLNAGGQSVALTGTGTQANANVNPGSIAFGSQPVATISSAHTITLQNNGSAPLTYGTTTLGGGNAGDFTFSDAACQNAILQPGDSCTITAQFDPTTTGSRSATLTVHDSDPNNPTQTVSLTGNGTPSSVGFSPSTVTFVNPVVAGLPSPVHSVRVTNTTNSNLPISSITLAGANPKSFIRSADTCSGTTLAPNASCSVHVEFAPTAAGNRTALLQVNDTGPIGPHSHQVTLTGKGTYPNNPKSVRASVGCSSTRFTWTPPTATRFAGVRVVRNRLHYPANIADGANVPRSNGAATNTGLKHFTTYYYRVFASYHSKTRPSQINYSAGVRLKERTGEVCTPQNGSRGSDLTPKFTWLASATRNGYSFVLQRGEATIDINYTNRTSLQLKSSWRYRGSTHRLIKGRTYTFFLYAYPASHPDGTLIGHTTFTIT